MKIEYFGHSCFRITTNDGTRIVTDPYTKVGYELPKGLQAEIVTVSHAHFDHNFVEGVECVDSVVNETDKYKRHGISITGITTSHDPKNGALRGKNAVYVIEADGERLCHLGDIGEAYTSEFAKKVGSVDVLFLPVGGNYTIDAKEAIKYVEGIKPKTAILMHYRPKDGTIDIDTETPFLSLTEHFVVRNGEYHTNEMERVVFMTRKEGI